MVSVVALLLFLALFQLLQGAIIVHLQIGVGWMIIVSFLFWSGRSSRDLSCPSRSSARAIFSYWADGHHVCERHPQLLVFSVGLFLQVIEVGPFSNLLLLLRIFILFSRHSRLSRASFLQSRAFSPSHSRRSSSSLALPRQESDAGSS